MNFNVKVCPVESQRSGCLIIGVFEGSKLTEAASRLDKASKDFISQLLKKGDLNGKIGQTLLLHHIPNIIAERVLLVGCGKSSEIDEQKFHKIINAAVKAIKTTACKDAVSYLTELDVSGKSTHWKVRQAVEAIANAYYQFDQLKSAKNEDKAKLTKIIFNADKTDPLTEAKRAIVEAEAIATGMDLTKNLGNLPGNLCTPTYLAKQAQLLADNHKAIKTTVLEEKNMRKLGMGALLSVAQGSDQPAKLITIEYKGGNKTDKPVVLVGKGVTFDSGGISIKPSRDMDEMKFDMSGAGSVLGTMKAVAELNLPINVVGVIPTTENLPSGTATKPGDIITTMSGKTVEITNTDAEGRLILADALTYCKKFKPAVVIDIASLTGAILIALGIKISGLFTNNDKIANDLKQAAIQSNDIIWQLPLFEEYKSALDSNFADIGNSSPTGIASSITAAWFLSQFAEDYQWAHLDIAGTGWQSGKEKGATGRPVPLLVQYLLNYAHS